MNHDDSSATTLPTSIASSLPSDSSVTSP